MSDTERNWGAEPWRAPDLAEGDTLLFSECGRIIRKGAHGHSTDGIDYRSHYFRVVAGSNNYGCYLLVKHGGGQERIKLDYNVARAAQFFEPLESDARYLLLHMLFSLHSDTRRTAEELTAREYKHAFATGHLRKRKARGQDTVKVWIER